MSFADKGKAVVTGGAGFIGSILANTLAREGYDTVALDIADDAHGWLEPSVALVKGDVRDPESLKEVFKDARFVFHCAALPRVQFSIDHPEEAHDTNVNGTFNVLRAAQQLGIERVVFSSSSSVYGDQLSLPLTEGMTPNPKSPYALHKQIGEQYCKIFHDIYQLPVVSLRYFNVYGPKGDPDGTYALIIPKFIQMRKRGTPFTITGDGMQTRDFTHVLDVVRANIMAAENPALGNAEVVNIGAGKGISINRLVELIGGPVEHIPSRIEQHDTLADISRAKKLLGWEPEVAFEEGIAEIKRAYGIA